MNQLPATGLKGRFSGERMTEELYATLSRNPLLTKFEADRRYRERFEGGFWF